jgi:hypothetical protein
MSYVKAAWLDATDRIGNQSTKPKLMVVLLKPRPTCVSDLRGRNTSSDGAKRKRAKR